MMPGSERTRYKLHTRTIGLVSRGNHQAATLIPAGTTVEVIGPAEDPRFLVVEISGEQLWVFETDLKDRSIARQWFRRAAAGS